MTNFATKGLVLTYPWKRKSVKEEEGRQFSGGGRLVVALAGRASGGVVGVNNGA